MRVSPEVTTDVAVLQRLVSPAGCDVLDVGCGGGWLVRELTALGARVTGLETSDQQLAGARAADPEAAGRYLVGRAESLPIPDASVDVVVFLRSLHHVAPALMTTALAQAARVLRPAGVVCVSEPVAEGDFYELVSIVENEDEVREAARAAIAGAASAGLQPVTTEGYAVGHVIGDVDGFRRRMVAVDPERAPVFDARRDALERAFARLGSDRGEAGGRLFTQTMRADVLRPAVAGAGLG